MKKTIALVLALSLVLILSVSAYSYFALSFDCADKTEYAYSDNAHYYADMNVILDYDPDIGLWYFYDTEFDMRVYVPDYQPVIAATATDIDGV